MSKASPLRIGVVVYAIVALLALSMLPPEHLHASPSGRGLVHRHVIDDALGHHGAVELGEHSALDRDDHRGVTTLDPTFVPERQHPVNPGLIAGDFIALASEPAITGEARSIDPFEANGPPIRTDSLPAPPA